MGIRMPHGDIVLKAVRLCSVEFKRLGSLGMHHAQANPRRANTVSPDVSILMPMRNAERFVAAAIESVLHQTNLGFRIDCRR